MQPADFLSNIDIHVRGHMAQFFDLAFKNSNRLFKIKKLTHHSTHVRKTVHVIYPKSVLPGKRVDITDKTGKAIIPGFGINFGGRNISMTKQ